MTATVPPIAPEGTETVTPPPVPMLQRPWVRATLGSGIFPLVVLFFIFFFDEFDTAAFGVLAPEIQKTFSLSDRGFIAVIAVNLVVVLGAGVPVGFYGDRVPRRPLVVLGAVVAGVFSLATGLAPTLFALVMFRIGNGFGLLMNSSVHLSLLSDYYKPDARPTVFAFHNNAQRWGAIVGPALAGIVTYAAGWRWAFGILIVPVLAMAVVALKLPSVVRGQSDDDVSAVVAADERAVPFGRAVRMVMSVKTLRWQYAAWVAIGAAFLPLAAFYPIFLNKVFHVSPLGRGFLGAANAVAALIGVYMAGPRTRAWLTKSIGDPIKYAGYSLVLVGPCIAVEAYSPWLALAVISSLAASFVGGWFWPPFLTTQSLVSPARVRTLAFSFGSIFLVAGLIVFDLFFAQIADHNIRNGLFALVPFWIIGGLILRGGHRYVETDVTRALAVLTTTAEMRRARLENAYHSILSVRNVDVSYGPVQVLFGIDLELAQGEILALLGTNGAGKSTLLKAISGLVPISGGAIFFDAEDITGLEPEESFGLGLVQVPGGKGIFPGLTVRENLDVAAWASRRPKDELEPVRAELLELFPSLRRRYDEPAAVLSGGEQQMLTLAQALVSKPKLLMIDELSLGLAPAVVEELLRVVDRIHQDGTAVILVEQSVNVALTIAERAVFMEKGEIRFAGATDQLLERDDILRAVFLGDVADSLKGGLA